jgi:hypothetical protein
MLLSRHSAASDGRRALARKGTRAIASPPDSVHTRGVLVRRCSSEGARRWSMHGDAGGARVRRTKLVFPRKL